MAGEAAAPAAQQQQTAAPAQAPAQAPAPGGDRPPAQNLQDAYSQLDAMAGSPPETPEEKPVTPKPGDKAATEPPAKPGEAPKAPDKAAPVKAGTLRENYDRLKSEFTALEQKHKALEVERAKPVDDPEKKTLTERLELREKRLAELEEEMRFTSFEKSSEYKDKYWKPFSDAYQQGRNKVASLKLNDGEGNVRQGTAEDFDTLMRITDDDMAAEAASDLFGVKAPMVLWHREKVQELNNTRLQALDDFRKQGGEREKLRGEQIQKTQKEIGELWETEKKAGVERFPKFFKAEDGDEKGNALLTRGFELADAAFGAPLKDPKTGDVIKLSPQEMVKLHSAIRNKAGGFDRLAHKLGVSQKRIAELETKLKQYEESEPSGGDGQRMQKTPPGSALDAADLALAKLALR